MPAHPRRLLAAGLALGVAAALAPAPNARRARAAESERPNVLLIVTDDQRASADSLQVMPETRKWLGDGGTYFPEAVVTTPLCCPSRASIMTGQYTHNHGVAGLNEAEDLQVQDTIQHQLGVAGYQTAIVGKYLNHWPSDPLGFDRWATFGNKPGYYNTPFNVDGEHEMIEGYSTTFIEDRSVDLLNEFENTDADPWFLYVAPYAPHLPATPEPKYAHADVPEFHHTPSTREVNLADKPEYVREIADRTPVKRMLRLRNAQLRTLMSVDDMVAGIRDELKTLEEERDTLVFFISDNGFFWYEHQLDKKSAPYGESVRVPLFVRWPRHVEAGAVSDALVANIDIAPTIYDALDMLPDHTVDGQSLLSAEDRSEILLEFFHWGGVPSWSSLWTPSTQYTEYESGALEFYAGMDPWQLENVLGNQELGDEPDQLADLVVRLAMARRCSGASCP